MRFHSTPQSALDGEITILAIIETVASVAIYVGLGLYFGTFKYLAWAVVVAPLMLFRTETSTEWGLNVYEKCCHRLYLVRKDQLEHQSPFISLPTYTLIIILIPIIGAAIRVLATLYWLVRRPLKTFSNVPQNWVRQSFCTDFFHYPEILPLEALKADRTKMPTFAELYETISEQETVGLRIVYALLFLPVIIIGYFPPIIYRVTFKATAIAYAPFIYVAYLTFHDGPQDRLMIKNRLESFAKGELEKVRRVASWFILATLLAKIALVWGWLDRDYIVAKFPSKKLAESLTAFGSWPWWQFTLLADALLTFFLFFFADAALRRLESPHAWKEGVTLGTVSSLSFLRAALALITIGHFFLIALRVVAPKSLQAFL